MSDSAPASQWPHCVTLAALRRLAIVLQRDRHVVALAGLHLGGLVTADIVRIGRGRVRISNCLPLNECLHLWYRICLLLKSSHQIMCK
jgi:hypothetical protein